MLAHPIKNMPRSLHCVHERANADVRSTISGGAPVYGMTTLAPPIEFVANSALALHVTASVIATRDFIR